MRWRLNVLSALSLMVAAVILLMWARSHWKSDTIGMLWPEAGSEGQWRGMWLFSHRGVLAWEYVRGLNGFDEEEPGRGLTWSVEKAGETPPYTQGGADWSAGPLAGFG